MSFDLIPVPGSHPEPSDTGNSQKEASPRHIPAEGKVFDPLVKAGFVDTDSQTAGIQEWDLPPAEAPWEGYEAARAARRSAERADQDADWGRRHGLTGYAVLRESDAADNRQTAWDWGDLRTWVIIWGMFFAFLLFCAFVYYMPEGRQNQHNNIPWSMPPIHVYTCLKELPNL